MNAKLTTNSIRNWTHQRWIQRYPFLKNGEGGMSIRARLSSWPRLTPHEGGGRASASWIHSPRIYVPHRPWRGSSEGQSKQCDKYLKVLYKSIWACPSLSANNNRSMNLATLLSAWQNQKSSKSLQSDSQLICQYWTYFLIHDVSKNFCSKFI